MGTTIDDLMDGGSRSAKFTNVGDVIQGTVAREPRVRQATEYKPDGGAGKPKFWDDGNPQEQIVITLATAERDPEDPADDGYRSVYIKTWGDQIRDFRAAVKASGAKLAIGGTLAVRYDGEGPATSGNPPKFYSYRYTAPSATDAWLGGQANPAPAGPPAAAAPLPASLQPAHAWNPAQPQQPAFAPSAAPSLQQPAFAPMAAPVSVPAPVQTPAVQFTPEQVAAMRAAGIQIPGM